MFHRFFVLSMIFISVLNNKVRQISCNWLIKFDRCGKVALISFTFGIFSPWPSSELMHSVHNILKQNWLFSYQCQFSLPLPSGKTQSGISITSSNIKYFGSTKNSSIFQEKIWVKLPWNHLFRTDFIMHKLVDQNRHELKM